MLRCQHVYMNSHWDQMDVMSNQMDELDLSHFVSLELVSLIHF